MMALFLSNNLLPAFGHHSASCLQKFHNQYSDYKIFLNFVSRRKTADILAKVFRDLAGNPHNFKANQGSGKTLSLVLFMWWVGFFPFLLHIGRVWSTFVLLDLRSCGTSGRSYEIGSTSLYPGSSPESFIRALDKQNC